MTFLERLKITLEYLFILSLCCVSFFGVLFVVLYMAFLFCGATNGICVDTRGIK